MLVFNSTYFNNIPIKFIKYKMNTKFQLNCFLLNLDFCEILYNLARNFPGILILMLCKFHTRFLLQFYYLQEYFYVKETLMNKCDHILFSK